MQNEPHNTMTDKTHKRSKQHVKKRVLDKDRRGKEEGGREGRPLNTYSSATLLTLPLMSPAG